MYCPALQDWLLPGSFSSSRGSFNSTAAEGSFIGNFRFDQFVFGKRLDFFRDGIRKRCSALNCRLNNRLFFLPVFEEELLKIDQFRFDTGRIPVPGCSVPDSVTSSFSVWIPSIIGVSSFVAQEKRMKETHC